ncbi:MAG: hypothetical protein QOC80_2838, partial [Frankiaceae bacterium]|nr:hypothetical protein [Frankiaceae bacterium]
WDTASEQTDETFAELSEEVLSGVI